MGSSGHFSDGRRQGKAAEKSNFEETCNLLSRYVKEKGGVGLRDFNIEIDGKIKSFQSIVKPESTRNLLTNMENSAPPPMDSFPHKQDSFIKNKIGNSLNTTGNDSTNVEKKRAPLTIFYAGRVLVFDDYPVDKAKELVSLAQMRNSQLPCGGFLSNTLQEKPISSCIMASTSAAPHPQAKSSIKSVGISSNACKETAMEANGSDMPIARRSSLRRFLEKRNDRSVARGPYQVQEQQASSSQDDEQLELKL